MNIIHRLCTNPIFSNVLRNIPEGWFITVKKNIKRELGNTEDKNIVDIACGTGQFSTLVKGKYTGIDLDKNHIEYAIKTYNDKNKKFIVQDASNTGFKNRQFDIALMLSFLHHADESNIIKVFKEAKRVTKEKIIIVDLITPKYNLLARLMYSMDQGKYIRPFKEQERLIKKEFKINKSMIFRSGIYIHSMFVCVPH
ncbi:class I SAM-dependent methyltransferase [Candidatus Woesearchaeota archaeon]|nr:class I SAM-dependent methyltransferase [Candidatus Woesearchaeota archaeon]